MASANGTTDKTAASMKRTAGKSRPATGGNKRVISSAKRKNAGSMVPTGRMGMIEGPDKGTG